MDPNFKSSALSHTSSSMMITPGVPEEVRIKSWPHWSRTLPFVCAFLHGKCMKPTIYTYRNGLIQLDLLPLS